MRKGKRFDDGAKEREKEMQKPPSLFIIVENTSAKRTSPRWPCCFLHDAAAPARAERARTKWRPLSRGERERERERERELFFRERERVGKFGRRNFFRVFFFCLPFPLLSSLKDFRYAALHGSSSCGAFEDVLLEDARDIETAAGSRSPRRGLCRGKERRCRRAGQANCELFAIVFFRRIPAAAALSHRLLCL